MPTHYTGPAMTLDNMRALGVRSNRRHMPVRQGSSVAVSDLSGLIEIPAPGKNPTVGDLKFVASLSRAEALAAELARDLERCVIANAAISRELNEPLDIVTETRLEAHAIGT